ncbi:MAG: hypothetical protein GFH27_549283n19 [Chloroflexi bacterium AL-W]|nr:hypothetical protein [Chloroflexi bacterium AL-N1]NOK64861.1 hypothetical protein [Chloroflexi bacterium AL-N10]NOK76631.1 hypothetical protein [Chloroflexi bacterium AL-N5]NOK80140.1 hypothetical protein [Chloroflexi bacterium AL-W]NOK86653.1 hypothetical protein [Chloroflexi bacterium AL-N15]
MKNILMRVLYWAPRILSLLLVMQLSLFALDVFGEGYGFWGTLLALLVHLRLPVLFLLVLALAWRWEWIGAMAFLGSGVWYLLMIWGREHWAAYVFIAGPMFLLAILFFFNWLWRSNLRANHATSA